MRSAWISAVVMSEELIEVRGRLTATLSCECGRCLEPFEQPLTRTFLLNFVNAHEEEEGLSEEGGEHEIMDKDISTEYFTGDVIELSDAIQEQIVMNPPGLPD